MPKDYFAKARAYTKGAMKARSASRQYSGLGVEFKAKVADKIARELGKKAAKAQKKGRK